MLTTAELHRRGLEASNAGRYATAKRLFKSALERSRGSEETARVLLSLAHVESETGALSKGLARCNQALALANIPTGLVGLIQSQRGLLLGRSGASQQALAAFSEALRLLDDDALARMRAHSNRGLVHLMKSDIRSALADLRRASAYARQGGTLVQQAKVDSNIGSALLLGGDVIAGLRMIDAAKPVLAPLSKVLEAVCEQDRAEALIAAGMTREAERALRSAAAALGARGLRQQQGEAELMLSQILVLEAPIEALKVARQARRRFERRGSHVWAVRADAVALAAEVQSHRSRRDLGERAAAVIGELRRHGHSQEAAALALHQARWLARQGKLQEACEEVHAARVTIRSPLAIRLLAREVQAKVARRKGRSFDALRHLRKGLADLHDWQSSFGSLDLQSSIVGHGRSLALQGLSLAVEDGRPQVVFEWSERARALASRVSPVRPPRNQDAAAELARLRQLRAMINESAEEPDRAMIAEAEKLTQRIRQRSWYDAGSGVVKEPVELAAVAAELERSGGILVSYLVVHGQVHALAVSDAGSRVVHVGAFADVRSYLDGMQADLDVAAGRLSTTLRTVVMTSLQQRLHLLSELLVTPVRDLLGDRPAVIVPSGLIAGVPWSMLEGFVGRPVTVPRSASAWLGSRQFTPGTGRAGFVAGPRVDRSEEEVLLASKAWPNATTLVGDQAHASAVSGLASAVDVFHVAAHGRHSAENPLFSGLELADGPLFGYDIDQLTSIPHTVVLSACEVGRSSVRWGEETVGMTVAWLHAGTSCVIASPAMVNDDAACELLAATHELLAAGRSPSHALAEASRTVDGEAPIPFMCFGSGW